MDHRLDSYVRDAFTRGDSPDDVAAALREAGWSEKDVSRAVSAWWRRDGAPPVPRLLREPTKLDAALYFLKSAAFFAGIWAVVDLSFTFVNLVIPEPGGWRGSEAYGIRQAVSTLTVTLPLYLLLQLKIRSDLRREPEKLDSGVRRWLIYLTMGVSGVVAMVSAIMLVNGMLAVEGNLNGAVKLTLLIATAGIVFADYWWALRFYDPAHPLSRRRKAFETVTAAVVAVIYVCGFILALSHREPERIPPQKIPPPPMAEPAPVPR